MQELKTAECAKNSGSFRLSSIHMKHQKRVDTWVHNRGSIGFVLKVCLYDVEKLSCTNSLRRRLVPILSNDSGLKEHISYNQSIIEWRCAIDSIIKLLFFIMQQYDSNY